MELPYNDFTEKEEFLKKGQNLITVKQVDIQALLYHY